MKIHFKGSEISSREIFEYAIELAKVSNSEHKVGEYVLDIMTAISMLKVCEKNMDDRIRIENFVAKIGKRFE